MTGKYRQVLAMIRVGKTPIEVAAALDMYVYHVWKIVCANDRANERKRNWRRTAEARADISAAVRRAHASRIGVPVQLLDVVRLYRRKGFSVEEAREAALRAVAQ